MKFVDQATITVRSGDGGPGCVSFRREKYVPKGGPDGGDGGRGGHVLLAASSQKDTLYRFHLNQHFKAKKGQSGRGKNQHGGNGADLVIQLPLGTIVSDAETGAPLVDLSRPGMEFIVAEGGRGGQGNARFATSTNRAPRFAQPGEPGLEIRLRLELKLLADVGLIGLPNAGKSTLISRISGARPKIADYPFTTLIPNLGVVSDGGERSLVVADIPGLIEGASQGAGLGHRFLKHVQRCRLLVHLIDAGLIEADDPLRDYNRINTELAAFDPELAARRQIVVINKMDMPGADEAMARVQAALPDREVLGVSALVGTGLSELKWSFFRLLDEADEQAEPPWET
ncbi:MAG: GTPase ObgE [Proteobacteria bacterium]|nr:GTPase ObgE [Pseudomonadota bacterium]